MLTDMKKIYLTPSIKVQPIESEDILDESLPIFNEANPQTDETEDIIKPGDEILGNGNSIWED